MSAGASAIADRAATLRAEPVPVSGIAGITGAGRRLRRWWWRLFRNPNAFDFRLIAPEHRHLYRQEFRAACVGTTIGLLMRAHRHRHLRSQRAPGESRRIRKQGWRAA